MSEIWKDIEDWEGIYQISNCGRLRRISWLRARKDCSNVRIRRVVNSKGWYLGIVLTEGKRRQSEKIHRLVAKAFVSNPENLLEVNHMDGNRQNNHADNLEWVDRKRNHAHAIVHVPTMLSGLKRYNTVIRPKRIVQYNLNGRRIAEFLNSVEAQRATGVCQRNILQVAAKTEYKPGMVRRQAGGYIWKFKIDEGDTVHAVHQLFLKFSG